VRRDVLAVEQLVLEHMPRARRVARGLWRNRLDSSQDAEQAAYIGLLHAARLWDPSRSVDFWPYARQRIIGAVMDEKRLDGDRVVHIGRDAQVQARKRGEDYIRPGVGDMEYAELVTAHPGNAAAVVEARMTLGVLLAAAPLNDNQRKVVAERLAERTCLDIGQEMGVSEARIVQIGQEALRILRVEAGTDPDEVEPPSFQGRAAKGRVPRGTHVAAVAALAAEGITEIGAVAARLGISRSTAWRFLHSPQRVAKAKERRMRRVWPALATTI
jgi:RNA polymerase sigma factor (sigma-70 family)